jgi:hypothetical protein
MKTYTTGQVAKICKMKGRKIAELFDRGEINGHVQESKLKRRSHRRISVRSLIDFMEREKIPFDELENDPAAQKVILCRKLAELRAFIARAKKLGDILKKIGQSPNTLLKIVDIEALGSFENVHGIARNNAWAKVLRKMAEVIEQHTRVCISNSKK